MMMVVWDSIIVFYYVLNVVFMFLYVVIWRGDFVGFIAFDEKVTRLVRPHGGPGASNRIIQATYDLFPAMVEPDYDAAFRTLKMHVRKRTLVVFISMRKAAS